MGKCRSSALWFGCGLALVSCQSGAGSQPRYLCQGNEPFWKLEIARQRATYHSLSAPNARTFEGRLRLDREGGRAVMEWRGAEDGAAGPELVASIAEETCLDSMSDETAPFSHRVRVTLPEDEVVTGCCQLRPRPVRP